jgi:hypothetical protein
MAKAPADLSGPLVLDAASLQIGAASKPRPTRNLFIEWKVAATHSFSADRDYWLVSVMPSVITQLLISLSPADTIASVTLTAGIKDLIFFGCIANLHICNYPIPNGTTIYFTSGAAARMWCALAYES